MDFTIKSLVAHGVPPTKILMGIPFYGRKFSIKETSKSGVSFGKTVVDTGLFHSITGYREICKLLTKSTNWNYFWNEKSSTPYIYNEVENFIFSYENTRSVAMKVKLAVDYGLAGFVTGTLPLDDFDGSCPVEEDTYEDFVDRHFRMVVDAISTRDALRNLNLPTWARIKNDVDYRGYYVAHEKIYLELPKPKVKKFPLLTAIYEAAALAEEEKIIADEINKLKK